MPPINFGIIGAGEILQQMKPAFQSNPSLRATAIADPNPAAAASLAADLNAVAHSDYRALLSDPAIDAIYIATPPFLHKKMILDSLSAGKHVLCEKPFALDSAEARELADASSMTNLKVACCSSRFLQTPAAAAARDLIAASRLGSLRTLTLTSSSPGIPSPKPWTGWKSQKQSAGGGLVMDWGVYDLDWMFHVLGPLFSPHHLFATTRDFVGDVESSFAVTLLCHNNLRIDWQRRNLEPGPPHKSSIQIRGSSAGLDLSLTPTDLPSLLHTLPSPPTATANTTALHTQQLTPPNTDWPSCIHLPLHDLADSILHDRPPLSSPPRQLQIHYLLDAIYQSAQSTQVIQL